MYIAVVFWLWAQRPSKQVSQLPKALINKYAITLVAFVATEIQWQ